MLIRAGTVDLDPPRRFTTVVPPVSSPSVSLPAATAPVPQRGTASVKLSPSPKFPSSSPAALLADAADTARSRTASVSSAASTPAKSVLPTKYAFMVHNPLWAGTSRCRLNFGRLTRNIMVGTTSFEYGRFVKYVHRDIERPSETLAPVETKKLPPGVPAKSPGPPGLQFCFFLFFTLTLVVFVAVLDFLLCLVGEILNLGKFVCGFLLHTFVL